MPLEWLKIRWIKKASCSSIILFFTATFSMHSKYGLVLALVPKMKYLKCKKQPLELFPVLRTTRILSLCSKNYKFYRCLISLHSVNYNLCTDSRRNFCHLPSMIPGSKIQSGILAKTKYSSETSTNYNMPILACLLWMSFLFTIFLSCGKNSLMSRSRLFANQLNLTLN